MSAEVSPAIPRLEISTEGKKSFHSPYSVILSPINTISACDGKFSNSFTL